MAVTSTDDETIWALSLAGDLWYPCDHMLLDPKLMANSENAKPFYGDSGKHYATLLIQTNPGSKVVPHPHADKWS